MDDITLWLLDHPEVPENFLAVNKALISEIRQRFTDYRETDDLISRFLMSKVLLEILTVETNTSKTILKKALQDRGVHIMVKPGSC